MFRGGVNRCIFVLFAVVACSVATFSLIAEAAVPSFINYQSRLRDSSGNAITATTTIQFSIYNDATNGSPSDTASETGSLLWKETYDGSSGNCSYIDPNDDGYFTVQLGTCSAFPSYLDFTSDTLYVGVKISSDDEASPRAQLGTTPYAFTAEKVFGTEQSVIGTTTAADNAGLTVEATSTSAIAAVIRGISGQIADIFQILSAAGDKLLTLTAGGLLGVGTSTPSANLHVYGTTGNNLFQVSTSTDDSIFTITELGRVGIGTTTPDTSLHVLGTSEQLRLGYDAANYLSITVDAAGDVTFTPGGGTTTHAGNFLPSVDDTHSLGSASLRWKELFVGPGTIHVGESGNFGSFGYSTTSNYLLFDPDGDEAHDIVFTDTGYVGIGDTSPDGKLEVRQIDAEDIFNLYDNATNVFTVLDGGNVGIGTSSPSTLLAVAGTGYFGGNLSATGTLMISGDTTLANTTSTILYTSTLGLGSDYITDLTGTGLAVISNALTVNLGNGSGTTANGNAIDIGGTLTTDASFLPDIDGGHSVTFGSGSVQRLSEFNVTANDVFLQARDESGGGDDTSILQMGISEAYFASYEANPGDRDGHQVYLTPDVAEFGFYQDMGLISNPLVQGFSASSTAFKVFDSLNSTGLLYAADYSSNFVDRSLPDVGWVNATIATATSTLPLSPNNILLTEGHVLVGDSGGNAAATSSLFISSTGSVGVGTTSVDAVLEIGNDTDLTELSITGYQNESFTRTSDYFSIARSFDGTKLLYLDANERLHADTYRTTESGAGYLSLYDSFVQSTNSDLKFLTLSTYDHVFYNNSDELLRITDAGDFGIGTSSPASKLDVWGDFRVGTSSTPALFVDISSGNVGIGTTSPATTLSVDGNGYFTGGLGIGTVQTTSGVFSINRATGDAAIVLSEGGTTVGQIRGDAGDSSINITSVNGANEYLSVNTSSGNVGIGTTTPAYKLQVEGDVRIDRTYKIGFFEPASANVRAGFSSDSGNDLIFEVGAASEVMRVDSAGGGRVGIGTSTPTELLSVDGDGLFTGELIVKNDDPFMTFQDSTPGQGSWTMGMNSGDFRITGEFVGAAISIEPVNDHIGIWDPTPDEELKVVGGFCVANNANDTCSTADGDIDADGAINAGNFDLAEKFITEDMTLSAGEVITFDPARPTTHIVRATSTGVSVLGVVSTNPGFVIGYAVNSDDFDESKLRPVGLSGRIPVNVSLDNGEIAVGDPLTLSSSEPGVAVKSTGINDFVLGFALEPYTEGIKEDETKNPEDYEIDPEDSLSTGAGQVLMFIQNIPGSQLSVQVEDFLASTSTLFITEEENSFGARLLSQLTSWFANAANGIGDLFATVIHATRVNTETLCVGQEGDQTCITKEQLDNILSGNGTETANNPDDSSSGGDNADTPTPENNEHESGTEERTGADENDETVTTSAEANGGGEGNVEEESINTPPDATGEEGISEVETMTEEVAQEQSIEREV